MMNNWTQDRLDRFKNILAFLSDMHCNAGAPGWIMWHMLEPEAIETSFLRFLGPNLPTSHEYKVAQGSQAIRFFKFYLEHYMDEGLDEAV